MDNIPEGYDENGVRNGDGRWNELTDEEMERLIPDKDDIDYTEELIECTRCRAIVDRNDGAVVGGRFYCERCRSDMFD
jgi:late competence protein required for DNA uptake (superfamily II DNA/RNA helicase)